MEGYTWNEEIWEKVNAIEGWLAYSAAHFTWALIRHQERAALNGPIVEFGVYKGKYLSLLAAASAGTKAKLYGFDGFFAGYNRELDPQWIDHARNVMIDNVESVTPAGDRLTIIRANTLTLSAADVLDTVGGRVMFSSVDAGHEADEVHHDMMLMSSALANGGIIAADDVFNAVVAEGLCRCLASQSVQRIAAFATVGNKMFFTTPDHHARYVEFTKQFIASAKEDYVLAARRHRENNESIGYAPSFFGREVVPFAS
jgi:Methyltransferase domain